MADRYRTEDGREFDNQWEAQSHANDMATQARNEAQRKAYEAPYWEAFNRGKQCYANENYDDAIKELNYAVQGDIYLSSTRFRPFIYSFLGMAFLYKAIMDAQKEKEATGKYDKDKWNAILGNALKCQNFAIENVLYENPDFLSMIISRRAYINQRLDNDEEAIADAKKAIELLGDRKPLADLGVSGTYKFPITYAYQTLEDAYKNGWGIEENKEEVKKWTNLRQWAEVNGESGSGSWMSKDEYQSSSSSSSSPSSSNSTSYASSSPSPSSDETPRESKKYKIIGAIVGAIVLSFVFGFLGTIGGAVLGWFLGGKIGAKFLAVVIILGLIGGGLYLGRPYIEPYIEPYVSPIIATITGKLSPSAQTETTVTVMVITDNLNLRSEASGSADIIKVLKKGDVLTATGNSENGWLPVVIEEANGWVSSQYVE